MDSSITDVPGIRVGHAQRSDGGWLTGVTVVLPPPGTVGAVDVRGGGPGTHETDALDPTSLVSTVDAVVLTGGSAFGLASATGVQRWCEEQGRGYRVGERADGSALVVPIVPAAAIFDLGRGGNPDARPDEAMGYAAAAEAGKAQESTFVRGNVGAGTGAAVDRGRFRGGLGSASLVVPYGGTGPTGSPGSTPLVVGALAVVNAFGAPVRGRSGGPAVDSGLAGGPALNTTLVVVATNAELTPGEAKRTAVAAHAGLARAIDPSHTLVDGDTVFVLSTGMVRLADESASQVGRFAGRTAALLELQRAAADVVVLAIEDGVASAAATQAHGVSLPAFPWV